MPHYIMLTNLTADGVQTLKNNPTRVNEVNKEVEQLGVKVIEQCMAVPMPWPTYSRTTENPAPSATVCTAVPMSCSRLPSTMAAMPASELAAAL